MNSDESNVPNWEPIIKNFRRSRLEFTLVSLSTSWSRTD